MNLNTKSPWPIIHPMCMCGKAYGSVGGKKEVSGGKKDKNHELRFETFHPVVCRPKSKVVLWFCIKVLLTDVRANNYTK